jgi:hypothetical protein
VTKEEIAVTSKCRADLIQNFVRSSELSYFVKARLERQHPRLQPRENRSRRGKRDACAPVLAMRRCPVCLNVRSLGSDLRVSSWTLSCCFV